MTYRSLSFLAILLALALTAGAQTIYTVTSELDDSVPTTGTLRWAVQQSELDSTADTIVFASSLHGRTITLTQGELNMAMPVTIQGPGASLLAVSGDNSCRIFVIDNSGAPNSTDAWTISGLTLRDAFSSGSDEGGAVYAYLHYTTNTLTVTGCVFDGNLGNQYAGGIEYSNQANRLGSDDKRAAPIGRTAPARKYSGKSFADIIADMDARKAKGEEAGQELRRKTDNREKVEKQQHPARQERLAHRIVERRPPAPTSYGLTVHDCTFTDNRSYVGSGSNSYGAAIYHYQADASIDNCIFTDNIADYWGGAIYSQGTDLVISRCTFTGNTSLDGNGGAIYFEGYSANDLDMSDCTFNKNSARYDCYGGAIYIDAAGSITAANCRFFANLGYYGGVIYENSSAPMTLTDCGFADNLASYGGAIYNYNGGDLTLTNCGFHRNFSAYEYGAIYHSSGIFIATDCAFTGNRSYWYGGAVYLNDGDATMDHCVFRANENISYEGGALDIRGNNSTKIIIDCQFSDNISDEAGAIYASHAGTMTIDRCCFVNNTSRSDAGGALMLYNTSATTTWTIRNSTFSGNRSLLGYNAGGGAIYWDGNNAGTTLALDSCTIVNNSAFEYGGGLYRRNAGAGLTITNCIIANNTASFGDPDVHNASTTNFTSGGYNLIGNGDTSVGWIGSDQVGTPISPIDPLLSPIANNGGPTLTHAPLTNSLALNAGSTALTVDQRNTARSDATDDIGAYEAGATISQPKIEVTGNGLVIASGDTTPSQADNTHLGSANVNAGKVRTFAIRNSGTQTLTLAGTTPFVTIVGSEAFKVSTLPASLIGVGGTTTFDITFTPTTNGVHTAAVMIASDDPAQPIYSFSIEGSGDGNHNDGNTVVTKKTVRECGATGFEALLFLLFVWLSRRIRRERRC